MTGSGSARRGRAPGTGALAGVVAIGVAAATLWVWRRVVFAPHLIESGDLLQPLSMRALRALYLPFWNPTFEFPNVETASRLPWMAPFLLAPNVLVAQALMVGAVVVLAAWSMLAAARRLGAGWALAALAGVAYAAAPWAAIRLQHYFLLPGYAALPLLLALWLRPLRRGTTWLQALLLTLTAASPHMLAFAWALSLLWWVLVPRRANLRRLAAVAVRFAALTAFWLAPTVLYTLRASLVPSVPTWELAVTFSRNASLGSVARLDGYWWPLAQVALPSGLAALGWCLLGAAVLGLLRPGPGRRLFAVAAVVLGAIALGTHVPWLLRFLALEGPLADRVGWLFRDPNKAVGPLASVLLLLAVRSAAGRERSVRAWVATVLVAGFCVYAVSFTSRYLPSAYAPHEPPAAFREVDEWLAARADRVLWLPRYNGARALWNGTNMTPEFAEYSSRAPALDSYGYDPRARRAYQALAVDTLTGPFETDVAKVLRTWGARWVVHHRDLPPLRAQPPGTFDNRVELLPLGLTASDLVEVRHDPPLRVYDAGPPVPAFEPATTLASEHPLATTLALQALDVPASGTAVVGADHPGANGVALLPGDDPRVLLAPDVRSVDLAAATVSYDPAARWSRLAESEPEWDARAVAAGLPGGTPETLVLTHATGAVLEAPVRQPEGRYRALVRLYEGADGGALELRLGETSWTVSTRRVAARSAWHDLGWVDLTGSDRATLTNLAGENAVARLALVPQASWSAATRSADLAPTAHVWPVAAMCPPPPADGARADLPLLEGVRDLPWQGAPSDAGARWNAYDAVRLQVYGTGRGGTAEVWTDSGGVWVLLGSIDVWWSGWRAVELPIRPKNFAAAPSGVASPVGTVKVLMPDQDGPEASRVRGVGLVVHRTCRWTFDARGGGDATLWVAGTAAPDAVRLDGVPVRSQRPAVVHLASGSHTLELARVAGGTPAAVAIASTALDLAAPGRALPPPEGPQPDEPSARRAVLACTQDWRLAVSEAPYVVGLTPVVGATRLPAVAVDHLRLGAWVPPGVCGALHVRNAWPVQRRLWSWVSIAAVLVLGAADALRRRGSRTLHRAP